MNFCTDIYSMLLHLHPYLVIMKLDKIEWTPHVKEGPPGLEQPSDPAHLLVEMSLGMSPPLAQFNFQQAPLQHKFPCIRSSSQDWSSNWWVKAPFFVMPIFFTLVQSLLLCTGCVWGELYLIHVSKSPNNLFREPLAECTLAFSLLLLSSCSELLH